MVNSIVANELVKQYGDLTAVKSVSFDVQEGEIFGFLGPNGAGKTTTINMLTTLLKITSGSASINGHDVQSNPGSVRESIGLIFQDPSLDEQLTGWENLRFHALLYDLTQDQFKERAAVVLDMVDLADRAQDKVREFSGGMRRRLEIARGLLHRPAVLFLDEPTIGLDPQTRRYIWEYITELRKRETITIFLTTHYMDEAEICDRIAIIDHGEIVALDTPENLKAMVGGDIISLRTSDNDLATAKIENEHNLTPRVGPEGQLIVETNQGEEMVPQLVTTLSNGSSPVRVTAVNMRRPTLEDVFIKLTGRAIRAEYVDVGKESIRQRMRMMGRGGGRR